MPDSDGEREYCAGIPVASLKDSTPQSGASSRRSSVSGISYEDPIPYRKFGKIIKKNVKNKIKAIWIFDTLLTWLFHA